jgi:hypothetical protein
VRVSMIRIGGAAAGDYVVVQDDCTGRTLASEGRCSIMAAFVPGAAGDRFADLTFEASGETRTVRLIGVGALEEARSDAPPGAGAAAAVNPQRVEFGNQDAGRSSGEFPVTFVNTDATPARIAVRLDAGPAREFTVAQDGCSNRAVPAGSSCIVTIQFRPRSMGTRGAVLVLRDITTTEAWTVPISGIGVPARSEGVRAEAPDTSPPVGAIGEGIVLGGPERLTFGPQRSGSRSRVQVVTLENGFDSEVRIANARLTGIDALSFGLANDRCSGSLLRAGGRCTLAVWFEPVEPGAKRAALVVRYGTGDVAREIELTGVSE